MHGVSLRINSTVPAPAPTDLNASSKRDAKNFVASNLILHHSVEDQTRIDNTEEPTAANKHVKINLLNLAKRKVNVCETSEANSASISWKKITTQYNALKKELSLENEKNSKQVSNKKILEECINFLNSRLLLRKGDTYSHTTTRTKEDKHVSCHAHNSELINDLKGIMGLEPGKYTREQTLITCLKKIQSIKQGIPEYHQKNQASNPSSDSSENTKNDETKSPNLYHYKVRILYDKLEKALHLDKATGLKTVSQQKIIEECIEFINSNSLQSEGSTDSHKLTDIENTITYSETIKVLMSKLNAALGPGR
ncbi:hypothetical protein [Endozoicomonas sp.]|uniref:hypothetical protein n=1 Tax=Endozoicomonas sp. TaxID=1892382 RepID=UPI00383A14DF